MAPAGADGEASPPARFLRPLSLWGRIICCPHFGIAMT